MCMKHPREGETEMHSVGNSNGIWTGLEKNRFLIRSHWYNLNLTVGLTNQKVVFVPRVKSILLTNTMPWAYNTTPWELYTRSFSPGYAIRLRNTPNRIDIRPRVIQS